MNFHKSQQFTLLGRIPQLADKHHRKETGHDRVFPMGTATAGGSGRPPSWLEYDMKVLCFDGYFHENLAEMQQSGSYRIRRVKIALYLEDETVQVVEPKIINSGLAQGNIVKRQRVTEATSNPENKRFITLLDLNVDKTVTIFDRAYHITSCDAATRQFLTRLGITVPEPVLVPSDPGQEKRLMAEYATRNKNKSTTKNTKFAQFLRNYRKVLLFHGYWDDRASLFGDVRRLVVHYYLVDDTMEIKEAYPLNSGRQESSSGVFLKRMRLPKQRCSIPDIGQATATFAVLNVMGDNFNSGRFIPDSVDSLEKTDYYRYTDLVVGQEIYVFGRKVRLTSCDDFTKKFYMENFGVEEFPDVPIPVQGDCTAAAAVGSSKLNRKYEPQLPPFNGWGTHEDSEGNCKTVEPKPPTIDYEKFVKLDGKMLRFTAKMVTRNIENLERTFIISYYLSNDTMAVYEIPRRNSGFSGGQFLHQSKFFLPDQDLFAAQRPKLYTPQHLYIGATVNLNSHIFQIIGAEDYALEYMERNRKLFPFSDINVIVEKCRNQFVDKIHYKNLMAKYWTGGGGDADDNEGNATITTEKVRQLLHELFPSGISEQEVLTVCRHFSVGNQRKLQEDERRCGPENKVMVRSIIHAELQRNLWSDWQELGRYVKYIGAYGETDNGPRDFLSPSKILTVIRGTRLPLNPGQVELMLYVLEKNDVGDINVADFLGFLRCPKTSAALSTAISSSWPVASGSFGMERGHARAPDSSIIDWNKFVDSIAV